MVNVLSYVQAVLRRDRRITEPNPERDLQRYRRQIALERVLGVFADKNSNLIRPGSTTYVERDLGELAWAFGEPELGDTYRETKIIVPINPEKNGWNQKCGPNRQVDASQLEHLILIRGGIAIPEAVADKNNIIGMSYVPHEKMTCRYG